MGTIITNLKARFGVDSADFKKGLKDGEKAVDDFKDGAGNALDKFASMFGVNMSAVNDALGSATKSLNFLGQSITGMATGANKAAVAFKLMKTVLISTGIGALVVALGSLVAYFQKSGEGADKFAKILAQVKSVVNNVIDRLAIFGKGIFEIATGKFKQGWETMRSAFKNIGSEIKEDWKASGDLADAWDALEDREIALINSLEERKAKAAELRLLAKEETEDQKKRLSLIQEAERIIKTVYADEVGLAQERFNLTKKQIDLAASDPTDEQRRELAELEGEINKILRQQSEELKSINREKRTALSIVNEEAALEKAKAAQVAIQKASLENISMPALTDPVAQILASGPKIQEAFSGIMVDLSDNVNSAFESMAVGIGEFFGALATGDASLADFGKSVLSTLAEVMVSAGKAIIAAGVGMLAVKAALKFGSPIGAIIAGTAMVAIGSALKGALSSAAGGGGGSASAISSAGSVGSAQAVTSQQQNVTISLTGKLVAEGKDLVYVVDQENTRKKVST